MPTAAMTCFSTTRTRRESDRNAGKWAQAFTQSTLDFVVKPGKKAWSAGATIIPADFTGDNLSEVFMMTPAGKWTVATFTSKGVTFKGSQWTAGWRASRAEFTGDGLADLFLYNPKNGKFRVVVRKGTTFTILKGSVVEEPDRQHQRPEPRWPVGPDCLRSGGWHVGRRDGDRQARRVRLPGRHLREVARTSGRALDAALIGGRRLAAAA